MKPAKRGASLIRGRIGAALAALSRDTRIAESLIGSIGYCFGGYAVLELARSGSRTGAVASFHGLLTTSAPAVAGDICTPILVSTGGCDPLVPPEDVAAFKTEMEAAAVDLHLLYHARALHSFTHASVDQLDDPRMRYEPLADAVSWAALLAFLDRRLGSN